MPHQSKSSAFLNQFISEKCWILDLIVSQVNNWSTHCCHLNWGQHFLILANFLSIYLSFSQFILVKNSLKIACNKKKQQLRWRRFSCAIMKLFSHHIHSYLTLHFTMSNHPLIFADNIFLDTFPISTSLFVCVRVILVIV